MAPLRITAPPRNEGQRLSLGPYRVPVQCAARRPYIAEVPSIVLDENKVVEFWGLVKHVFVESFVSLSPPMTWQGWHHGRAAGIVYSFKNVAFTACCIQSNFFFNIDAVQLSFDAKGSRGWPSLSFHFGNERISIYFCITKSEFLESRPKIYIVFMQDFQTEIMCVATGTTSPRMQSGGATRNMYNCPLPNGLREYQGTPQSQP